MEASAKQEEGRVTVLSKAARVSFAVMVLLTVSVLAISYNRNAVGVDSVLSKTSPGRNLKKSHGKHSPKGSSDFEIYSTKFDDGDYIPDEYTCYRKSATDVIEGASPPLKWKNAPDGTEQYLLTMWSYNEATDVTRYDWVVYDIDDEDTSVSEDGGEKIGTFGGTYPEVEYMYRSPCSSGHGDK
jgi:Phosphatidylethanolamine-binding protein